ncbi:flagellar hook-associated protein FlgL [Psychromonas sp. KJ10-10]|uniref:flagellar hook-associated protein FlgL n=1 Tax=Psychromonas sp. KJ10-10 TaxID=3391823 RepID=UPI0039B5DE8D
MRISTQMFYQRNLNNMLDNQSTLSQQNMHLSTQKRVMYGSDDAVAISTIQRLKQELSVGEQNLQNADMAEGANALEDTALTQVTNILQRVRELTVTAGNDTYSAENREVIAEELEGLLDELVGVANTKDGNSQYIFAGYEVDTKPFQKDEFGLVEYEGDDGSSFYKVGPGVLVQGYDSGASVFENISEGNGTFVSEGSVNNTGSGVVSSASVIDKNATRDFVDQDYAIVFAEPSAGADVEYSVYGLDDESATGNANVKISQVDDASSPITGLYPETGSSVDIQFIATANANEFEIQVNGVSSLPTIYDSSNTDMQELTINGVSLEVDGVPNADDTYSMIKYVEPTLYVEGQSIEFNGIKTGVRGNVETGDSFTLTQSGEKSVFSTIQDTIDSLRVPGDDDVAKAQR